jgi:hypothetical protein
MLYLRTHEYSKHIYSEVMSVCALGTLRVMRYKLFPALPHFSYPEHLMSPVSKIELRAIDGKGRFGGGMIYTNFSQLFELD